MSVRNLPTLADMVATRSAVPKHELPTRLKDRGAEDKAFKKAWTACCKAVDLRDKGICRSCGRRTVKCLRKQVDRAEHAHLVRRSQLPEKLHTDARLVLLLCGACHEDFDQYRVHVVGTAKDMVKIDGMPYLNADSRGLKFVK